MAKLTKQESIIATMIVMGSTNEQIIAKLVISPMTLKTHIKHIYKKLGIKSTNPRIVLRNKFYEREQE